jgi:lipase
MTAFRILRWGPEELPPVVCLHDVRGHARRFERLARTLEPGRLVVAYDLRGHGRSPWSGPHTIAQHAEDLDEVLDAMGIDQTGLIGDSFGARVAIDYAVRNQERITSLTLLEPPVHPLPASMHAAARAEREGGGYDSVDDAIERRRREDGLEHTPRALLEEEMAEHLVADEDGRFRYRYSREAAAAALDAIADPETRLGDVLCPTMVIGALGSTWLGEAELQRITDELRKVRVEEVPGGHVVLWDALAETSAHVRDFLVARRKTA